MATLQDVRAWANQIDPLFICGLERSGTSILQVSLARHPDLFNIKDVYETFAFINTKALLEVPMPSMAKAYLGGGNNGPKFRQFCSGLTGPQGKLSEEDTIRAFFYFAGHFVYPGRRPLEKTPGHVRKLDRMFALFPKAKVVVCTRDPLAVVASYRKRLKKEQGLGKSKDEWGWLDRTDEQLIGHFEAITKHMMDARAKHGDAIFVAPYDWMTNDAEGSLKAICEFADLPFEQDVLTPKSVPGRKVDELLSAPITKRESEVDQFLNAQSQELISERTASMLPLWNTPGVAAF